MPGMRGGGRRRNADRTVSSSPRATATPENDRAHALEADVVIGAVFVAGQPTPKLLPRSLVKRMKRGAMIVDISIDAGGVAETSRPTTHADPTYVEEGVVHYCVPNIPAADPPAASKAISEAVLPYVLDLCAPDNVAAALMKHRELRNAVLTGRAR
jgi:alanine dehydrogenase